jgi:ribosomal subunit interface protein
MAFPISRIKTNGIDRDGALAALVEQKFATLEKFTRGAKSAVCEIELEKISPSHSGDIFRAEANLELDGRFYRSEATTDRMEKSIDAIHRELAKELRRSAGRSRSLLKRGGAAIKRMVRFGRK